MNVLCLGVGTVVGSAVVCTPNSVHPASVRAATGHGALVSSDVGATTAPMASVPAPGRFATGAINRKTDFRACFLTISDRVWRQ